jgi:ABC-type bacteriocin/lantibiotic exporter with double-glycine peptidase domain
MSIKNPMWILLIAVILAILGYYSYVSWNLVIGSFVIYIFSLCLWIEFEEIKTKEGLKSVLTAKIENIEMSISNTVQKIDSEERIKERLMKKRKEVIEWLNKF